MQFQQLKERKPGTLYCRGPVRGRNFTDLVARYDLSAFVRADLDFKPKRTMARADITKEEAMALI